jgi:hypothetical protein
MKGGYSFCFRPSQFSVSVQPLSDDFRARAGLTLSHENRIIKLRPQAVSTVVCQPAKSPRGDNDAEISEPNIREFDLLT